MSLVLMLTRSPAVQLPFVQASLCPDRIVILCNLYCCRFLSRSDSVTVGVWNSRKVHRREGAGFLGCVRLTPTTIARLKDTGCEWP